MILAGADELPRAQALAREPVPFVEGERGALWAKTLSSTLSTACAFAQSSAVSSSAPPTPSSRTSRATDIPTTRTCADAGCASATIPRLPTSRSPSQAQRKRLLSRSTAAAMRRRQLARRDLAGQHQQGDARLGRDGVEQPAQRPGVARARRPDRRLAAVPQNECQLTAEERHAPRRPLRARRSSSRRRRRRHFSSSSAPRSSIAAWAAARRAIGTRYGEQLT